MAVSIELNRRTLIVVLAAAAAAWAARSPSASTADVPATAPAEPGGLAKVRQAEVDTLRQGVDLATQLYSRGLTPTSADVDRLSRLLVETRLRLAASPADRAAVLRDGLAAAKDQEALATSRFKAGLCSDLDVADAEFYRLRLEEQVIEADQR